MNRPFTADEAVAWAGEVRDVSPRWIEEPVRPPGTSPCSPCFGPGLLATPRPVASWGTGVPLEWYYATLGRPPFGKALVPRNGAVALPEAPGLGLEPLRA